MKSLTCTVFFPSWVWTQEPHTRFICSSYADSLSIKHRLDRRTLISPPWYRALWGNPGKFSDDQNLKGEFQNHARGLMIATSTGGSVTGKGADFIIVDDPHNPLQVLSDTERVTALRHFDAALSAPLDDPKREAIVVVMQRLHEDDLAGHLIGMQGWEQVSIPAEAARVETWRFPISKRVHVRNPGEIIWPGRRRFHPCDSPNLESHSASVQNLRAVNPCALEQRDQTGKHRSDDSIILMRFCQATLGHDQLIPFDALTDSVNFP